MSVFSKEFQSTLSARRATNYFDKLIKTTSNFNPRSPRGERQNIVYFKFTTIRISIHALREESDLSDQLKMLYEALFQSTLSARRATASITCCAAFDMLFQSTLSARRATNLYQLLMSNAILFQSTLSARRATCYPFFVPPLFNKFQSTLSARRATLCPCTVKADLQIFQSTLSARRATPAIKSTCLSCGISIHALREESDNELLSVYSKNNKFQSTLSARRATAKSNIIFTLKSTMYLHFFTKL